MQYTCYFKGDCITWKIAVYLFLKRRLYPFFRYSVLVYARSLSFLAGIFSLCLYLWSTLFGGSTGCWPPPSFPKRNEGRLKIIWTSKTSHHFPILGLASDIAKLFQINIYVKHRSGADMNSPFKRKCWTNSVVHLYKLLLWGGNRLEITARQLLLEQPVR